MRWYHFIFILTSLTACQWNEHPTDTEFSTYLNRVANVQQETAFKLPIANNTYLPEQRNLILPVTDVSLGFLDSYELRKCNLFHLIAEKNSILGKVQDQFRNFDYQVQLVIGIKRCLVSQEISHSLKDQLRPLLELKQSQLPAHFNNLIFASNAMRSQLTGRDWVNNKVSSIGAGYKHALQDISISYQLIHQPDKLNANIKMTPHQEVLEKKPLLGLLSYSMQNSAIKLNIITQQLNQFDSKIICGKGRDQTRFKRLTNVFQLYFINKIQPYLAKIDSLYLQASPFLSFTQATNPKYIYPINNIHREFRLAISQHTDYWKQLFKRCDAMPSR